GQVHANLAALTGEVLLQALHNPLVQALGNAHDVLRGPAALGLHLLELAGGRLAKGAKLRRLVSLVYVTTTAANPLHDLLPPWRIVIFLVFSYPWGACLIYKHIQAGLNTLGQIFLTKARRKVIMGEKAA